MKRFAPFLLLLLLLIPQHAAHADITTGLAGYWPFDEGTGTTANDVSGNGNTGTLTTLTSGIPTWIAGHIGPFALNFNGTSAYVNVPNAASLNPTGITVSAWVRGSSFPNSYNTIVQKGDTSTHYYEYFIKNGGKVAVYLIGVSGGTDYDGTGTFTLSPNTWYMVTFTYDGTNGLIGYVNGTVDGTAVAESSLISNTGNFEIGRDSITTGRLWNGDIDDVRVYNRPLSQADITQLYAFTGILSGHIIANFLNSSQTLFLGGISLFL